MSRNRICALLGIQYPIIQAPMNWVSGAELTAAVSNAGGLGSLGPNAGADDINPDVDITAERMRRQIRKVRELTGRPFAVNVIAGFGEDLKYSRKIVEILIEETVPVAIVSVGKPDTYTQVLKDAGVKVFHAISTVRHAEKAEKVGVDAVVCEGFEAGGHKGFTELTTLVLTPMVADRVRIPVITGGGIGDARGVLAAMALGADAVYMGTRFMATKESDSHPRVKDKILKGRDVCTASIPKEYMLARDLANHFTQTYLEMKAAGTGPEELKAFLKEHSQYHAQRHGRADDAEICCGQIAGMITEVKTAGQVMAEITESVGSRLEELKERLIL